MKNSTEKWVSVFVRLGNRLADFGHDACSQEVIAAAVAANPWFSCEDIVFAAGALRGDMLRRDILEQWLSCYETGYSRPKKVAVIMAGNIPFAGFFDMMCVLVCGHECYIKPSSKDAVLIDYIVRILREIEPAIVVGQYMDSELYDAVIATGSDNTNRYFREKFSDTAALLRASRYSAALLDGLETESETGALAEDIFRYNGMGCRSVSLLFLPEGYDVKVLAAALLEVLPLRFSAVLPEKLLFEKGRVELSDRVPLQSSSAASLQAFVQTEKMNPKYIGNYRQTKGLMTVLGQDFIDGGCFVMVNKMEFPTALSVVNYAFYHDVEEVRGWLSANNGKVQTVVSRSGVLEGLESLSDDISSKQNCIRSRKPVAVHLPESSGQLDFQQTGLGRSDLEQFTQTGLGKPCSGEFTQARFGQAQHPAPWDYPDCRDVIEFFGRY